MFIGFVLGWDRAVLRLVLGTVLVFALSTLAARLLPAQLRVTPPPEPVATGVPVSYLLAYVSAFLRLAVQLVPEYCRSRTACSCRVRPSHPRL